MPVLSGRCISLERGNALYRFASGAMRHESNLRKQKRTVFDPGYMEYIERMFPMDCEWYYLTDSDFASFVDDYVNYKTIKWRFDPDGELRGTFLIQPNDVLKFIREEKTAPAEELALINNFFNMGEKAKSIEPGDSVKLLALKAEMEVMGQKLQKSLNSGYISGIWQWMMAKQMKEQYDTLLPTPYLRELQLGKYYMEMLDQQRQPLSERLMSFLEENITTPGIIRKVKETNEVYRKLINKEMSYLESLKDPDNLKEFNDAKTLFEELTMPYQGNVVYLDIWGTWCAPCREQMAYTGAVKEALKGEKVIYMYLANRSDERAWKSLIREYDLTGENVVHYRLPAEQQEMLERMLKIDGFPTYMLLDKKGNIVNPQAPRPEQKDMLVNEIRKLLKE